MPILTHQFDNGLALLAEPMPWLESAAFSLLVPAGCTRDPAKQLGLGSLVCEMAQRGAGNRDSRQFLEDLELLGVESSSSVSGAHTSFSGAMPAESLPGALSIYADAVRRPHLPADELEESRLSCLQEVRALEDDLAAKAMQELRLRQYGDPFGRASHGTEEGLQRIKLKDVKKFFQDNYGPSGAILSVAGKIEWDSLLDLAARLFADWKPTPPAQVDAQPPQRGSHHIEHESTQTHIALAYDNVPYSHPDYYESRAAIGVLSDGMSSRLFTEVREKRGLCYTVYASCHSLKDRGCVACYAGTTTERAQQTLDVIVTELRKLTAGIDEDELRRLKSKLKSSLILQQESSTSRANAMAGDWYYLARILSLGELSAIVENLSVRSINNYLAAHPPGEFTLVTLGEKQLVI